MTTDTNLVPILKRHGRLFWETACTVNRGVLPIWYQYCGDERRSVTSVGAQADAGPEACDCAVLACGDGTGLLLGLGEGDGPEGVRSTCAGVEPAASVRPVWPAWSAVERAASIPFAAQLRAVSSPMPTARTSTRRRQ
jgi:hypothetical protein